MRRRVGDGGEAAGDPRDVVEGGDELAADDEEVGVARREEEVERGGLREFLERMGRGVAGGLEGFVNFLGYFGLIVARLLEGSSSTTVRLKWSAVSSLFVMLPHVLHELAVHAQDDEHLELVVREQRDE